MRLDNGMDGRSTTQPKIRRRLRSPANRPSWKSMLQALLSTHGSVGETHIDEGGHREHRSGDLVVVGEMYGLQRLPFSSPSTSTGSCLQLSTPVRRTADEAAVDVRDTAPKRRRYDTPTRRTLQRMQPFAPCVVVPHACDRNIFSCEIAT